MSDLAAEISLLRAEIADFRTESAENRTELGHLRKDFEGFATRMEKVVAGGPIDITRIRLSVITAIMLVFVVVINFVIPIAFHYGVAQTEISAIKTEIEEVKKQLLFE